MHTSTRIQTNPEAPKGHILTDDEAKAESARRVAAGHLPLQRMEAPGLVFDDAGDALVWLAGGKLKMATLSVVPELIGPSSVSTEMVADTVIEWAKGVVFADRASLSAVLRALERSGSPIKRQRGRVVSYMTRLPLNSQFTVLTDALASRYVAPGESTIAAWRSSFRLSQSLSQVEALVALARIAGDGDVTVLPKALATLAASGVKIRTLLNGGHGSAVHAYNAVNSHVELWSTVERTDPLLRLASLRSGDTVTATPFKMIGGIVECLVSTPFKLRPGSSVIVWADGGPGLPATLLDLGYDPASGTLTARFTTPATRKRRSNGYDMIFDKIGSGESVFVTTEPYTGSGGKFAPSLKGGRQWKSGQTISRELPLYVSLAAAATPARGAPTDGG